MLLRFLLSSIIRSGSLRLIEADGSGYDLGDGTPPSLAMRLRSSRIGYSIALNPALSLGEAYMDGRFTIEGGSLYQLLELLARNLEGAQQPSLLGFVNRLSARSKQANPIRASRKNVAHHYDLDRRLYEMFLDTDLQYSCAYFERPDDTLEAAQENKKRHILRKLLIDRPGLHILDIGCGWGGLMIDLARRAQANVTGVTLSTEQYEYCQQRIQRAGLHDRVQVHLTDYRQLEGTYDRIVSVGMFEHVGKRNYPEFFGKLRELLSEDGTALLHSIGYFDTPAPINPFVRKYIFPGADLPSLSELISVVERERLVTTDVEILRLHYAETLRHWRQRFLARRAEAAALYDDRFCRMWEFYLAFCEIGFRFRTNVVFQVQLAKRLGTVPLTRNYIYSEARPNAQTPARAMLTSSAGPS